jgi:hypothetical protein
MTSEEWVEVWSGKDPAIPGRKLDAAGLEMRLAAPSWGEHGGGLGVTVVNLLLRRKGEAVLLVRREDVARAKTVLGSAGAPPKPPQGGSKSSP